MSFLSTKIKSTELLTLGNKQWTTILSNGSCAASYLKPTENGQTGAAGKAQTN